MTGVPLPRRVRPGAAANSGRGAGLSWGALLLGCLFFAGAFAVGLWLAFPVEWFRQAIARQLHVYRMELAVEELTISPTIALLGRQAVISSRAAGVPPLAVEHFSLRPLWSSLLSGDPGVHLNASLLQGHLEASLFRSGQLQAQAGQLVFNLPVQGGLATLQGIVDKGELHRTPPGKGPIESSLTLLLTDCTLSSPVFATASRRPLALGKITLAASGRDQAFTITRLEAGDGDLLAAGNGTLFVGASPADSRLTLNLQVRPTAKAAPELTDALGLLAKRSGDGSYPIKIGGTLAQPLIEPATAGRQELTGEE